jgi:hypothetical protein
MKLHEFINNIGHKTLSELLDVTTVTTKNWSDYDNAPTPLDALKLIKLSHGALTFETIYHPYCEKKLKDKGIKIDRVGIQPDFGF